MLRFFNGKSVATHSIICRKQQILLLPQKTKKSEVITMANDQVHLSIRAPKQLMKDLKIIAIQQDTTVTNIVLSLLNEYVEENKK